jgi:hypothetical protein
MDQQDLDTLHLKDPDIAWAILTPSPHLTDYPVDDLHALHLVYVDQCWHPPLSRTVSAWQREHRSEGQFKYAVIDARFEYKGRSLYERAILYVGNEAAILEEILQGTSPTYCALKPEGTDSRLLIHTLGQEIPREIRVPDGANIHEITAGVLNSLGPRKYHQVSVRYHIGVSVFKLMGEGAANPNRLTKRQLNIKRKYDRIGWEIPFDFEEPDPILPYGGVSAFRTRPRPNRGQARPSAGAVRLRLKVENGHRSTIIVSVSDAKESPAEDSYASLRISLQKVWREFHPHDDNQRARQKTGSMPPLQRH